MDNRFKAARIELSKAQGMERIDMEKALKGWVGGQVDLSGEFELIHQTTDALHTRQYNPKKLGLGPSLLVPSSPHRISLMSPSLKLSQKRVSLSYGDTSSAVSQSINRRSILK